LKKPPSVLDVAAAAGAAAVDAPDDVDVPGGIAQIRGIQLA